MPKPDAIVAVVDATNLERNLYLVTQLFEFGIPVVIALTMIDVFEKQKHEIDIEMLSAVLKASGRAGQCKKQAADATSLPKRSASAGYHADQVPYRI